MDAVEVCKQSKRSKKKQGFCVCTVLYLFFQVAGGVTVPAHPAEASGWDEVSAEEGAIEVRRWR
jgi:hypothetical protein